MIKFSDIQYYTIQEVAKILNVRAQTVYGYVWQGRLKNHRLGRRTYIREDDFKKFVTKGFGLAPGRKKRREERR